MNHTNSVKSLSFYDDVLPLLRLCIPLVIIGLMQSAVFFFENVFLAKLGPAYLAAGGLVAWFFGTIIVTIFGTLGAVNVLVAYKHGEKDIDGISKVLRDGLILALLLIVPIILLVWNIAPLFLLLGQNPHVVILAQTYLHPLAFGIFPRFIAMVLIELLLGLGLTRTVTIYTVCTIPFYIFFTYALTFGAFGMPKLGIAGTGWGSVIGDWISGIAICTYIIINKNLKCYLKNLNQLIAPFYLWEILALGLPMGLMYCFEVGFFFVITLLMGLVSVQSLSANQLAMQYLGALIGTIFSIAQGLTIRMGHEIGAKHIDSALRAVNAAVIMVFIYMCCIAVYYWFFSQTLIAVDFNLNDPENFSTIKLATQFLFVASFYQIVEAIRITLFGALRGLKETRFSLLASMISFWGIALPLGYLFSTPLKFGGIAFWYAMTFSAACSVSLLYLRYQQKIKHLSK